LPASKTMTIKSLFLIALFVLVAFCSSSGQAWQGKVLIVRLDGTVLVSSGENTGWQPARKWMNIPKGAKIKTLSGSSVDLLLDDGAIIRIKAGSELAVRDMLQRLENALSKARPGACRQNSCRHGTVIQLFRGKALFYVSPKFQSLPMVVDTPIGIAGVTGTRFVMDLTFHDRLFVAVFQGHVVVWQKGMAGKPVLAGPMEITETRPGTAPTRPEHMNKEIQKRYEECLKLHLGLDMKQALTETGGRYKGTFSRGYSPEVLYNNGPVRTYGYQQRGAASANAGTGTYSPAGPDHAPHAEMSNRTHSKKNPDHHTIIDHHDTMDHHTMDHHDMTDRHSTMDGRGMSEHSAPRTNPHGSGMSEHSAPRTNTHGSGTLGSHSSTHVQSGTTGHTSTPAHSSPGHSK